MEEGYKLNEFHCACSASQPVHISSHGSGSVTGGSLYKSHPGEVTPETRRSAFVKSRSTTMYCSTKCMTRAGKGVSPNLDSKGKIMNQSTFLFRQGDEPAARCGSVEEESKKLTNSCAKALSAAPLLKDPAADVTKSRSTTDSEAGKADPLPLVQTEQAPVSEDRLKQKLTQSLSPSPFRNEDPGQREAKLEQLVASPAGTVKGILFSQFYGSELADNDSHHVWKIALKDHIVHTFESICLIKKLKPVPSHIIEKKKLPLEPGKPNKKKLIVFDLDETLAHCVTENIEKADHIITVTLNTNEKIKAGVNIRPHAVECLKQLAEYYELIVFTASHPYYADIVIDLLDPGKTLFSKRLFRSSCIHTDNGLYIKDLRVLNCDMRSTVIVDNAIFSFAFQLDNGIPMIPFYDDKEDNIMPKIRDYLLSLKELEDVRVINRKTFSLTELCELDVMSFLKYYYEDEPEVQEEGPGSDKELKAEDQEDPQELKFEECNAESLETSLIRRKSYSFVQTGDPNPFKIGKKAQADVENQLEKLMQSLPKYLASQQQDEALGVSEHKYKC